MTIQELTEALRRITGTGLIAKARRRAILTQIAELERK